MTIFRTLSEPLGIPGVARQLAVSPTSASVTLTATCRRISMVAKGSDMRFVIATTAPTANAGTSHWIGDGTRLDFMVLAGSRIAAIIATGSSATSGALEITELNEPG